MKEFIGVVKNITHQVTLGGVIHTTPAYNVEYFCCFNRFGEFSSLICSQIENINTIPHMNNIFEMCTGRDFKRIINEAYPDEELIHLVCERFFRQYNEVDQWGTPRVLEMCGFDLYHLFVDESNLEQLLSEYDYYFFNHGDQILKLTNESKKDIINRDSFLIKRKQQ